MHILVTNDDGVQAPGLLALVQSMRRLGEVSILAPDHNWSASGHVKTLDRPLRVREVRMADGTPALASDGAPSDCVALALLGAVQKKIDLVVAGINPYPNVGHDVTYSGTVTSAMEAVIAKVPGLAFSLDSRPGLVELDYAPAAKIAGQIVSRLLKDALPGGLLPEGVLLNINIPGVPETEIKGIKITRQGMRVYRDELVTRIDPRGQPYYWIGGEFPTGLDEEGTDFGALFAGYVSITPLQLDLTAYSSMDALTSVKW